MNIVERKKVIRKKKILQRFLLDLMENTYASTSTDSQESTKRNKIK